MFPASEWLYPSRLTSWNQTSVFLPQFAFTVAISEYNLFNLQLQHSIKIHFSDDVLYKRMVKLLELFTSKQQQQQRRRRRAINDCITAWLRPIKDTFLPNALQQQQQQHQ